MGSDYQTCCCDHPVFKSGLILFFSLPFRPANRRNWFYNGHIALSLDGRVFQIYNPRLLKAEFLFSEMPYDSWLFGNGGKWVDRDRQSPFFRHVYLYGRSESDRTIIYAAGITVAPGIVSEIKEHINSIEYRFRQQRIKYSFISANCSSIIAALLADAGLLHTCWSNTIPVFLFKRFVRDHLPRVAVVKISSYDRAGFSLHRFCIGLPGIDPENTMDRWVFPFLMDRGRTTKF